VSALGDSALRSEHHAGDERATRAGASSLPPFRATSRRVFAASLIVGTHLLLPLSLLLGLAEPMAGTLWVSRVGVAATFAGFLYFCGAWGWISLIARPALIVVVAGVAVGRLAAGGLQWGGGLSLDLILNLGLTGLFGALAWSGWRGRRLPGAPVLELEFPLRGGTFLVAQGGSTKSVNYHGIHPSQRYAIDFLGLGPWKRRARGLYPRTLARYWIFDAQVVSPCDGLVVAAVSDQPDFEVPDRDPRHPAGNHVAIETEGATVFLAHLRRGSVLVAVGEAVTAGQPIGRVGNSGNTSEPHLHIHAEKGPFGGRISTRPGLPMSFEGRFLVRNDQVGGR
jgi:Peptidase family M23